MLARATPRSRVAWATNCWAGAWGLSAGRNREAYFTARARRAKNLSQHMGLGATRARQLPRPGRVHGEIAIQLGVGRVLPRPIVLESCPELRRGDPQRFLDG